MTHAQRSLLLLPLAALALALPGRAFAGDESPAADDRARAVAAALENENLRMRARIDTAAILEKAGRHDEAIAALAGVEVIRSEGKALVERLLRLTARATIVVRSPLPPAPLPPTGFEPAPAPPEPKDPTHPRTRWYPPDRTGPDPGLSRLPYVPTVASGVRGLLAARGADRFWHSGPAGAGPADLVTTGMAVLALLDASDPAQQDAVDEPGSSPWNDAAFESLTALVAVHDAKSGRFFSDSDPEAHAITTWALAAGLTRFNEAPWRAPLKAAVARALADRNAKGLWPSASGTPDDDWTLAGFEVAMLHEAAHHVSLLDGLGVAEAIGRAGSLAFADQITVTPLSTAAGAYARACLARQARRDLGLRDGPLLPHDPREVVFEVPRVVLPGGDSRTDVTALLFATALRVGGDSGDLDTWQRRVLTPVFAGEDTEPRTFKTWGGGDARSLAHGTAYSSACVLLAWLAPTAQLRFPKSP